MMSKTACLLLAISISLISFAPARAFDEQKPAAEQDQAVRLKSELVQVRAVVTDKRGQPVADLKKEDFELLEDNKPQEIRFFSVENISNNPISGKPSEQRTLRTPQEAAARTVVLYVDTMHMSFEGLAGARQTLKKFVDEQMTDRDVVALVTSSGALGLMEQFTRDRNLLRAAINKLRLWHPEIQDSLFTPFVAARVARGDKQYIDFGIEIVREEYGIEHMPDRSLESLVRGKAGQVLAEASYRRKATLSTVKGVIERTALMQGQRLVVLLSEGFTLSGSGGSNDSADLQPAITRAVRSGVVIYSLGVKGLQAHVLPPSHTGYMEHVGRPGQPKYERPSFTALMEEPVKDRQEALTKLARDTGGEAFFDTNDISGRLQKALNDNRIYYALAYQAPDDNSTGIDKPFHSITLRVKNHPEYKVRTQRGYQPLVAKAEEQALTPRQRLAQAVAAPLLTATIPVSVSADYFERERDAGKVYVHVYIDANAFQYRAQDQNHLFNIEMVIMIYDLTGKRVHISTNQADGSFTAERLEVAKRNGYRYTEQVSLKPGVYQTRIGVLEGTTERIGTATGWVEVPDITKGKLTLSAIMLTKELAASQQAVTKASQVESLSPAVTPGIRVYKQGDELGYHLMVYPGSGKNQKANELLMQIGVNQSEQQVFQSQWDSVESYAVEKDNKGIEVGGNLKLKGIKPGVYELRIAVKSPNSKKPSERVVLFGVEP